ncbi:hypothetical protein B0T11DRAFT_293986 [Plectosphaerella cucumerina]|uniref:Uncharacterized protein n=1 Tax=Plectosphaerella cucumerina TaxID=40658 RepID=A0A8K0X9K9_9PEZI|nr:hypothetical protein B0T11DRAFT_293986 [Plectosphaerella cucumerina]
MATAGVMLAARVLRGTADRLQRYHMAPSQGLEVLREGSLFQCRTGFFVLLSRPNTRSHGTVGVLSFAAYSSYWSASRFVDGASPQGAQTSSEQSVQSSLDSTRKLSRRRRQAGHRERHGFRRSVRDAAQTRGVVHADRRDAVLMYAPVAGSCPACRQSSHLSTNVPMRREPLALILLCRVRDSAHIAETPSSNSTPQALC